MAKLHRIHLVAVGHHEARFHPLSLRFDHQGVPMDAVMNLRNGGGKTSLLSLVYAVLLPGKTDFLGRVNESARTLDEYFTMGRLGVVALELSNQVGRFTLLLAWVRRDREEPPLLFSFLSGANGIPFDELPLQGLVDSPLSSLGDLERWLKDRHARNPGNVDLTVAPNYREWHTHLKKDRGVDPHLYRTHLAMNRSEGAVDEEFKFTKTSDFVRRYLEFAIEAPSMGRDAEDPVTASLNEHRLSLTKLPHYRREIDFIGDMLPALRDLDGYATRRKAAEQERTQSMVELGRLAEGITFLAERYRQDHQGHEADHLGKRTERDRLVTQRDNAKRYVTGYDRLARDLRIKEARQALDSAKQQLRDAGIQVHEFTCALLWREVRRAAAKLKALIDQRAQLQRDLQPDRDNVEQCAIRLEAAFNDAIAAAELLLEEAQGQVIESETKTGRAETQLDGLKRQHGRISQELSAARTKIEAATRVRDNLVTGRVLQPREDAADAEKRLSDEVFRLGAVAKTRRSDATDARNRARAHRQEGERLMRLAGEARTTADRAHNTLHGFETERDACGNLEPVQQVLEGGAFDPFNPGVGTALRGRERTLRQQLLAVGIERAEDRRLIEQYDAHRHPLFPVPQEVEKLLLWLREHNVRGIMTGYDWLNANLPSDQAQARLRADPAAYSGLVVNTAADLEAASTACTHFALSRPVRITLSANLAKDGGDGVTVLPERTGLYNARAAVAELGQISEDQRRLDEKQEELNLTADAFAAAATQVEKLRGKFPAETVAELRNVAAQNEVFHRDHTAAAEGEKASASAAEEDAQQADTEAASFEQRVATASTQLTQVKDYRTGFGNHLELWLKQQADKTGELAGNERQQSEADAVLRGLKTAHPGLVDRSHRADMAIFELRTRKTNAKLGAYLPADFTPIAHGDIATEEAPFFTARDAYEQKAKGPLDVQIGAAEHVVTECESAFSRAARGLKPEKVAPLSETPDLELRHEMAKDGETQAKAAESRAQAALEQAEAQKPKALGINERADLDPGLDAPQSATEAEAIREEKQEQAVRFHSEAEALRETVVELESKAREARTNAGHYQNMLDLVTPARGEEAREHVGLTGEPDGDRARVKGVKRHFEESKNLADELGQKMETVFEKKIDLLVKHEKWDNFTVEIRDKFRRFTRKEYEAAPGQLIADCEERKAGLESKIIEAEQLRDTLIDKLYDRANEAIRSLDYAAKLSRMPEGLGAWSAQPFLRVRIPNRGTQDERRVLLGRLMDSWMAPGRKEMSIPRGAALAFDCLVAVLNQREIDVEILKPEAADPTMCNYQPVTKLASFSGGQRVIAAILLYCVIVRVRSDQGDGLADCGFLVLDNPFGKASHFPLVDLQLKMARVMGVQLIYLTGINDFEALACFPLRLRLRNIPRKGASGERLVQPESNGIESTRLGEVPPNGNTSRP